MLLILDGNNIAFVANTAQTLSNKAGFPTQAIYGFLEGLKHYIKQFEPTSIITVFDGGHSQERKALLPDYKNREKKDEQNIKEFFQQLPKIKDMLLYLGIDTIERQNTEADDIIAFLAQETNDREVIIVSSDKDFYQLIDDKISIYNPASNAKVRYLHSSNFKRVKELRSSQWLDYRAMTGDASDKIPGIPGVGKKTAMSILQQFGSYRSFRKVVMSSKYSCNSFEKRAFDGNAMFTLCSRLMNLKDNEFLLDSKNILNCKTIGIQDKNRLRDMFKELEMREALADLDYIMKMIPRGKYA